MKSRNENVKYNIVYSFLLKIIGVLLSFFLFPLTMNYLTAIEYGIWVTLVSMINWINMFDVGIGLGLRNKLAEAVSKNDLIEIREYISTGVFAVSGIGIILLFVFIGIINIIPIARCQGSCQ